MKKTEIRRNNTKKSIVFGLILVLAFVTLLPTGVAFASTRAGFSIRTVMPDSQIRRDRTFFDLQTEPGQAQTVVIMLYNNTDADIQVEATIATATTNSNGIAEYRNVPEEPDDTLLFSMEDIVTVPELVDVPAEGSYALELEIQMPEEPFDGVLAGGIALRQRIVIVEEEEEEVSGIRNRFAYMTAILLWQGDVEDLVPEPILRGVRAEVEGQHVGVFANIQNTAAMFLHDMVIRAVVRTLDEDGEPGEILIDVTRGGAENYLQMAPNSNFDFLIPDEERVLGEGAYHISLEVSGRDEKSWDFEDDFIVEFIEEVIEAPPVVVEEPPIVIEEEVEEEREGTWHFVLLIVLISLAVIAVLIALIIRYRKKKSAALDRNQRELLISMIDDNLDR